MFREIKRRTSKIFAKIVGKNRSRFDNSPDQSSSAWIGARKSCSNITISSPSPAVKRSQSVRSFNFSADTPISNWPSSRHFSTKEPVSSEDENEDQIEAENEDQIVAGENKNGKKKPVMWHTAGHKWDNLKEGQKIPEEKEGCVPVQFVNLNLRAIEREKLKTQRRYRYWVPLDYTWSKVRDEISNKKARGERIQMWTEEWRLGKVRDDTLVETIYEDENKTDGRMFVYFYKF